MKKCLAAVLFLFVCSLAVPTAFAQGRKPHHPAKKRVPLNQVKKAAEKLERLEKRLADERKLGKREVEKIALEIKEARLELQEFLVTMKGRKHMLPAYECCPCGSLSESPRGPGHTHVEAPPPAVVTEVVAPEEVVEAMDSQQFANLLGAMRQEGFADDKLKVLSQAARHAWFSVEQTKEILKQLSFPDDKLTALRTVRDRLVDPENAYLLYSAFVHSSDKDEAKKILEAQ